MRRLALAGILAGLQGCSTLSGAGSGEFLDGFPTGQVEITTNSANLVIPVEIAETDAQRTRGLSGRAALPSDRGMLFLFEQEQAADQGVWMFRVQMPLSIAYVDSAGAIVAIRRMDPCTRRIGSFCPRYPPGAPYHAALEVNRGFFEQNGVQAGDRLRILEREEDG